MDNTIPQDDSARKLTPKPVWIYALADPTTQQIRYIGKTNNLHVRFLAHLRDKEDTHKARWIRSLQAQGLRPTLQVLEETTAELWIERETALIAFYRAQGCDLTNISEGGQGDTGHPKTEEHKEKIAASRRGKKRPPEVVAKVAASKRGKKMPPRTDEWRRKNSEAQRNRKHTPEHIAKCAAGRRGTKASPETCAILSIAQKKRWAMKKNPPGFSSL